MSSVEIGLAALRRGGPTLRDPLWHNWDGGKLGGRPVRARAARLSLPPPPSPGIRTRRGGLR